MERMSRHPSAIKQEDDLRVVDENGHRVLAAFSLRELGGPLFWEP